MPGFADLTEEELLAVVRYEREVLGEVAAASPSSPRRPARSHARHRS